MVARNGLTVKGSGSGYLQEVQKHAVRRLLEIERGDLTRHVHGDPALKSQHHILEGPVQVMDLIEMKPLFQHHGHAEHPLLRKLGVFGHLGHGHVAVHDHRLG